MSEPPKSAPAPSEPTSRTQRTLTGDIFGGLSAAIIALPLALGFGVISFAPLDDPAAGALAGLYGAIFTGIFAAIFGGTPSQVTGPTGPMTVVTTSVVVEVLKYAKVHGHEEDLTYVLTLVFLTGMLGGIFQIILGVVRAGTFIKFIPYPVIAGFMNGIAVIIFLGQMKPFFGMTTGEQFWDLNIRWPLVAVAVSTVAFIMLAKKYVPKLPAGLVGLLLGTGVYFLMGAIVDPSLLVFEKNTFIVGDIPRAIPTPHYFLEAFQLVLSLDTEILRVIIPPAIALAVLGAIDSLLTSLVADVATQTRHNSNRELIGQGIGNVVSGAFGGFSGAGATVRTLVNVANGGRSRISGAVHGGALLLVLFVAGPIAGWIPMAVLAGILVVTSINMVDQWSLALLRKRTARREAGIIIAVTVITVAVDLMVAVGIGLGISVLLFLRDIIRTTVVRSSYRCAHQRSKRVRGDEEEHCLAEKGDEILVYELQGALFFGVTDKFATEVEEELKRGPQVRTIIFSLRHVTSIDITGAELIKRLVDQVSSAGCRVKLAELRSHASDERREMMSYLEELQVLAAVDGTYLSIDDALEAAEDRLIAHYVGDQAPTEPVGRVRHCVLFDALNEEEWKLIESNLDKETRAKGDIISERGDPGDMLSVVDTGHVSVYVAMGEGEEEVSYRVASFGAGRHFGDVTFLDAASRTGKIVCDDDTVLYTLSRENYDRLEVERPEVALKIVHGLAHRLSERLRVLSEEQVTREQAE